LTAESILKRAYTTKKSKPDNQETENIDFINRYKGARCKVCLIKEKDQLPPMKINNANKVYELVKDEIASSDREILLSVMLDSSLHLIGIETVAIGSINVCGSTISEIFKGAILANATCIILCHNHPSGSLEASAEDIAFTKNVINCGMMMGIRVHDHLVVSSRGYCSMNECGLIKL
jgi:DNA repair protein RadC